MFVKIPNLMLASLRYVTIVTNFLLLYVSVVLLKALTY